MQHPKIPDFGGNPPEPQVSGKCFVQHEEFRAAQNTTCYVPMNMNLPAANYCDYDVVSVYL